MMDTQNLLRRIRKVSAREYFKAIVRCPLTDEFEIYDSHTTAGVDALNHRLKCLGGYQYILPITEFNYHETRDFLRRKECYCIHAESLDGYGGQIIYPVLLFNSLPDRDAFQEKFPHYIRAV